MDYEAAIGDSAVLASKELTELASINGSAARLCLASNAKAESMAMRVFMTDAGKVCGWWEAADDWITGSRPSS